MPCISLYFIRIPGKRIITTLSEDFQLIDMLEAIKTNINDTAVEDYVFFCKGKRLSLDDSVIFQTQKDKLINDGSVIFIGNKIANSKLNPSMIKKTRVKSNENSNTFELFDSFI